MPPIDPRKLAALEAALERHGMLLLHDRVRPSVTTLVAGEAIRGSWWAHPRGNEIYHLALAFEHGAGALSLKLVNAKVTFVHRRLWPLVLAATSGSASPPPSRAARDLLARLEAESPLAIVELRRSAALAPADLERAVEEIDKRLLAHVTSEHTRGGRHDKVLRRWADWGREHDVEAAPRSPERARAELEAIARALAPRPVRVRLPWK